MNTVHPALPAAQQKTLRRAIRIEWFTIGFLAVAITGVNLVMGSSQAMKAAWIEDLLSLAPPIAFLIAVRIITNPPSDKYPYGFFRSVGVAHLVAGVALCTMGTFLLFDSVTGLISGDRPPIGSVQPFGTVIWSGWLMMGVMALTIPPADLLRSRQGRQARCDDNPRRTTRRLGPRSRDGYRRHWRRVPDCACAMARRQKHSSLLQSPPAGNRATAQQVRHSRCRSSIPNEPGSTARP